MPRFPLSENIVPELTRFNDDLIGFREDTTRSLWPGLLIVAGFGIPCIVGCTFLGLFSEGSHNPIFLWLILFAFTLTIISGLSYVSWCADATTINARSRTVNREYYFLGKRPINC